MYIVISFILGVALGYFIKGDFKVTKTVINKIEYIEPDNEVPEGAEENEVQNLFDTVSKALEGKRDGYGD